MNSLILQFEMHLLHHIDKENSTQSTLTHKYMTKQRNIEKLKMRTWVLFLIQDFQIHFLRNLHYTFIYNRKQQLQYYYCIRTQIISNGLLAPCTVSHLYYHIFLTILSHKKQPPGISRDRNRKLMFLCGNTLCHKFI